MIAESNMTEDEYRLFTTGTWVYPHPIALSCARIIRSRSEETLVDALLKGAEILTRYLAAVSLASYSVRAVSYTHLTLPTILLV